MRRDRMTFGMMIGVPLMQLILFGFAINSDPKQLPAAVLSADHGPQGRTLLSAIQQQRVFRLRPSGEQRIRSARSCWPAERCSSSSLSRRTSPAICSAAIAPSMLVEADATDPAATSNAVGSLRTLDRQRLCSTISKVRSASSGRHRRPRRSAHPREVQPGSHHPIQHRAGVDGRGADDDHGHDHRPGDHTRTGTRHDGKPPVHADASLRGDDRARSFRTFWSVTSRSG